MSFSPTTKARRRYDAVEAAYTSGSYAEALNLGLSLLQDLEDPASQPLRMRLLLLLAHTWLYGLGDADSAAVAYGQVAEESDEEDLQVIAADGLRRTDDAIASVEITTSEATPDSTPKPIEPTLQPLLATDPIPGSNTNPSLDQAPWATEAMSASPPVTSLTAETAAPWLQDLDPSLNKGPAAANLDQGIDPSPAPFLQPAAEAPEPMPISASAAGLSIAQGTGNTQVTGDPRTAARASTATEPEPRSLRPEQIPAQVDVVTPSAFSFSPEEEQELAQGLLLVVIG